MFPFLLATILHFLRKGLWLKFIQSVNSTSSEHSFSVTLFLPFRYAKRALFFSQFTLSPFPRFFTATYDE
jgi:hypothetical protein